LFFTVKLYGFGAGTQHLIDVYNKNDTSFIATYGSLVFFILPQKMIKDMVQEYNADIRIKQNSDSEILPYLLSTVNVKRPNQIYILSCTLYKKKLLRIMKKIKF